MDVTVIRHGTAEDRAATDADRALTPRGRAEVAAAGDRLASRGGTPPDSIIASPLLRARQSAEVVARRVGFTGPIQIDEALVPDGEPAAVRDLLAGLGERRHVVLVAHEPILSAVCSLLTGAPVASLHKAEIVSMTSGQVDAAKALDPAAGSGGRGPFAIRFRV